MIYKNLCSNILTSFHIYLLDARPWQKIIHGLDDDDGEKGDTSITIE